MKAPRIDRPAASIAYLPSATLADADDTTLVRGLLDGDPRATREAWRRFGPMVRRILLRTLGPESELEDLSQEVFITFFDRVRTLRDPRTLTAFIMSITAFKIRHHLRWRWLRRWLVLPGQVEKLDLRTFQPNAEAREALNRFFRILDKVNATDRTAFTLRFVEEMELREVATAMEMSLATTKRRLARTWKRLAVLVRTDPSLGELLPMFENGIEGEA
ncbi:MAG TPA: sigma-70 family RNA polymerase sigma factor [Polyangia bacterium]|jgi:RNA polymerase sigma-70 factor, ECF subfamily|nr:sigma-70 family RNA polymerase sigma factor [Polyangia bacterium]